jgi:lipopolysaccharide transport system permease protein
MRDSLDLPPDYELVIRPTAAISLRDVRDVWRYRELLWTLAARDVRVRYKQAAFGVAWAVIQPVVQMIVYTVLFNRLAHIQSDSAVPYALFTFAGTVIWGLFSAGLNQASSSLVDNANVIKKVYFPRIVIPLAAILVAVVDFVIGFALVVLSVARFTSRCSQRRSSHCSRRCPRFRSACGRPRSTSSFATCATHCRSSCS